MRLSRVCTLRDRTEWTSWTEPDHTNTQYEAMVAAIRQICSELHWPLENTKVWCDYCSIPQRASSTQQLAIQSLFSYSSCANVFIAIVPTVEHQNTSKVCDRAAYMRRMWCRAEQLFHSLRNGTRMMYISDGSACRLLESEEGWLHDILRVFEGDATLKSDRLKLVLPVLGLYEELYAADLMRQELDQDFTAPRPLRRGIRNSIHSRHLRKDSREDARSRLAECNEAATLLQSVWRGHHHRQRQRALRRAFFRYLFRAVLVMQRWSRGFLDRRRFARLTRTSASAQIAGKSSRRISGRTPSGSTQNTEPETNPQQQSQTEHLVADKSSLGEALHRGSAKTMKALHDLEVSALHGTVKVFHDLETVSHDISGLVNDLWHGHFHRHSMPLATSPVKARRLKSKNQLESGVLQQIAQARDEIFPPFTMLPKNETIQMRAMKGAEPELEQHELFSGLLDAAEAMLNGSKDARDSLAGHRHKTSVKTAEMTSAAAVAMRSFFARTAAANAEPKDDGTGTAVVAPEPEGGQLASPTRRWAATRQIRAKVTRISKRRSANNGESRRPASSLQHLAGGGHASSPAPEAHLVGHRCHDDHAAVCLAQGSELNV